MPTSGGLVKAGHVRVRRFEGGTGGFRTAGEAGPDSARRMHVLLNFSPKPPLWKNGVETQAFPGAGGRPRGENIVLQAQVQVQVDEGYVQGIERLVAVVQDLSRARTLEDIQVIVRSAARQLTGADGATFVLRDGEKCFYADEDAIAPLWKGMRFPLSACISGWAMLNRRPAVIEDIYADARIPADAYRPTFVKSLAMVPIRTSEPIGAIGNYWATRRMPTDAEVRLLQALADATSIAIENV
jgi:hypothetical protein